MREDSDTVALAERISDFKSDPEKLQEVTKFLDELLELAERNADTTRREKEVTAADEAKRHAQEQAAAAAAKRRLGSRARGFMVRLFEALCNCSQTAAAAARTHTQSLRASKR